MGMLVILCIQFSSWGGAGGRSVLNAVSKNLAIKALRYVSKCHPFLSLRQRLL